MNMSPLNLLLAILFPKICISCRQQGSHLCEDCISTISINSDVFPAPDNSSLTGLISAVSLQEPLIQKALRYYKNPPFLRDLSSQFAFLIISHLANSHNEDILHNAVLYPTPTKSLKWIGFSPSKEIAERLSSSLNIPLASIKNTQEKRVLLVNDIYEETMEETALALKEEGAEEIWGVVVARG